MDENRLIIFDLDGVLIDSKDWHYTSLNAALEKIDQKYIIPYDEHLSTYDGLNTTKKLELLTKYKNLPVETYETIWSNKQIETLNVINKIQSNLKLYGIFSELKRLGFFIAVASNSIRKTVDLSLHKLGIFLLVDYVVSNEDVEYSKPYPEMYWKCMKRFKVLPTETLIIEDSPTGRKGAIDSGATLLGIDKCGDLSLELIINKLYKKQNKSMKWKDDKLNVLIPMAGLGSRFLKLDIHFQNH